jgi:O-antigen/teichoic acid export membrane protein
LHHQLTINFTLMQRTLLPAGFGLSLAAPNFVLPIVGPAFFDAVIALAPWLAAVAVMQYFDYWFRLERKTGYLMFILTTTAVVNVGLNVMLILRYGEFGCAMGAFLRSCPIFGARAGAGPARIPPCRFRLKESGQLVFATLLMAAAMLAASPLPRRLGLAVKIAVGDTVYMASLVAVNHGRPKTDSLFDRLGCRLRRQVAAGVFRLAEGQSWC